MAFPQDFEIERIGEHVARVPLPLPLKDLPQVNTYAIVGTDGVTLVDPGWKSDPANARCWPAWRASVKGWAMSVRSWSRMRTGTTTRVPSTGSSGTASPSC